MNDHSQRPLSVDEQIAEQRETWTPTRRAVAPGMEEHLYAIKPVLDHGFVRVVDYMGDDTAITHAARVSYGKGTKAVQNDEGLIRYLMRHWHSTPFEMCEVFASVVNSPCCGAPATKFNSTSAAFGFGYSA